MNNVLEYLEKSAREYKDKIAFVDEKKKLTFSEVKQNSLIISNEIINNIGYVKNKPVLIYLPKSTDVLISMLGSLYSGNFYTPTSTEFPLQKLKSIINTLKPSVIITNTLFQEKLEKIGVKKSNCILLTH